MSFWNNPADDAAGHQYRDSKLARADAARAARLAGHKSLFRRLAERLRPRRQEPVGDPQSNYGTSDDPGR
jgi:hypothetical protein